VHASAQPPPIGYVHDGVLDGEHALPSEGVVGQAGVEHLPGMMRHTSLQKAKSVVPHALRYPHLNEPEHGDPSAGSVLGQGGGASHRPHEPMYHFPSSQLALTPSPHELMKWQLAPAEHALPSTGIVVHSGAQLPFLMNQMRALLSQYPTALVTHFTSHAHR